MTNMDNMKTMLRFKFNPTKAIQAMARMLRQLGETDKVKLMKLLYLSDREHLIKHDRTITGGRLVAMDHGPLPSECLSLINGDYLSYDHDIYETLHLNDHRVSLRSDPGDDALTASEKAVLDDVIDRFGHMDTWPLRDETHRLPEYAAFYEPGTSRTIPVDSLIRMATPAKVDDRQRIRISTEMAAAIHRPFNTDDSDL